MDEEFRLRVEKNKAAEEERTAKKRAKRQRQKARKAERNAKKPRPPNSEEPAINSANDTDEDQTEDRRDPNSESSLNVTSDSHKDVGGTRDRGSEEDRGTINDPDNSVSHELDHAPQSHPEPHTS